VEFALARKLQVGPKARELTEASSGRDPGGSPLVPCDTTKGEQGDWPQDRRSAGRVSSAQVQREVMKITPPWF
jgi:hypothetical protein